MLPLIKKLQEHHQKEIVSFHIPGHKYGQVGKKEWSSIGNLLALDGTELTNLDDLHDPEGCIKEAQQLAATLYGVDATYFLVNGSTVGNLAMIMGTVKEGDKVLVQRNCHKSIMNGLKLVGAQPIFISSLYKEEGLPIDIHKQALFHALEQEKIAAIILTTPNYYGYILDIREIVEKAHQKGIPVLIDEAHGAHFVLGKPFPHSAIEMGADIVVQSAHKTLPALTMASYLHFNSTIVEKEKIESYLHLLQSSSPSYLLMASLDFARHFVEELKEKGFDDIIKNHQLFKKKLQAIPQFEIVEESHNHDPLKLIIRSRCELNGFQLQRKLEAYGIYTELADSNHVLCVLPLSKIKKQNKIIEQLKEAVKMYQIKSLKTNHLFSISPVTYLEYNYKELERLESMYVPFEESAGHVAAEDVIPYPPGVPVVLRGERIEQTVVDYLIHLKQSGAKFQGSKIEERGLRIYTSEKRKDS